MIMGTVTIITMDTVTITVIIMTTTIPMVTVIIIQKKAR